MKIIPKIASLLITLFSPLFLMAAEVKVVVDQNGKGDFKTIQEAINSLPDSSVSDRLIYIRDGIYKEKVFIGKNHLVLLGESKEKTIITVAIADVIYECQHPDDKYTAAVNLNGNDITIKNLTIENTYGITAPDTVHLDCINRLTNQPEKLIVPRSAHQFALRSFRTTRLKVINCVIRCWGADAIATWNAISGMYYFKDCTLQGGTDFYCPRGWAYAENCTFICLNPSPAAIWHDGHADKRMKSVLVNCKFQGSTPYKLGRYHHDAQFFLINCSFDKNLMNLPIYKAETAKEILWGQRAYFYNCHKAGGDYDWLKNNLEQATGAPSPETITVQWAFDGLWNPIKINP